MRVVHFIPIVYVLSNEGPTTRAELHADYILKMVDGYQTENIHCIVPKATAIEDYNTHRDDFVKSTLWDDDRKSSRGNGLGAFPSK